MADKYIPIVYVPSDWIKDPKISSQISAKVMKIKETVPEAHGSDK